jgi:spermidine synthase
MSTPQSPWTLIDRDQLPGGSDLALYARDGTFMIRSDGLELMTSEAVRSEEVFVGYGIEAAASAPGRVLIGGLGLGFTMAQVCRQLPGAEVVVAEISPAVARWLKGPARNDTTRWLDEPRVTLMERDVLAVMEDAGAPFDLILLDIDNGPEALVLEGNAKLYDSAGLQSVAACLAPDGAAVFWSAIEAPWFEARLKDHFDAAWTRRYPLPDNPRVEHFHFLVTNDRRLTGSLIQPL